MNPNAKCAVITGATGGIGVAIARRLSADGWNLHLCDISDEQLQSLAESLPSNTTVCKTTLDSPSACAAALPSGEIDALVHLAGIFQFHDFSATGREVFDRTMQHNATNAYDLTGAVQGRMVNGGRIVYASSLAFNRGAADNVSYSMAKGALVGLTRAVSRRLAARNILVNAIAPGLIQTAMLDQVMAGRDEKSMLAGVPLGRVGNADEVAGVIRFLLSDDASYITGQLINIDGGMINS